MPIYEYKCEDEHTTERYQAHLAGSEGDCEETICRICGKVAFRVFSGGQTIIFSGPGTGWSHSFTKGKAVKDKGMGRNSREF